MGFHLLGVEMNLLKIDILNPTQEKLFNILPDFFCQAGLAYHQAYFPAKTS